LIDVDEFKRFNDRYGHIEGDSCLKRVAAVLRRTLQRPGDLLARYGGEEFVCLMPETPADGAHANAERMREAVARLAIAHDGAAAADHLTISVGVASAVVDVNSSLDELLAHADGNLYRAKSEGRNRVVGP
jgi:diguanylate cyclase (GGDEF)-like protein